MQLVRTSTRFVDMAFTTAAPKLWNGLPLEIRTLQSVDSFKCKLKSHLYIVLTLIVKRFDQVTGFMRFISSIIIIIIIII